jgi:cell division initiation protein
MDRPKPVDILNKTFGRAFRGYNRSQVDEFMRSVSAEMERVLAENVRLSERLSNLESGLARYKEIENTLNGALVLAQKTADDVRTNARKEADLFSREVREQMDRELDQKRRELQNLLDMKERFLVELHGLLRSYMELCERADIGGRTSAERTTDE